mgnify:CR=1 FL=1
MLAMYVYPKDLTEEKMQIFICDDEIQILKDMENRIKLMLSTAKDKLEKELIVK